MLQSPLGWYPKHQLLGNDFAALRHGAQPSLQPSLAADLQRCRCEAPVQPAGAGAAARDCAGHHHRLAALAPAAPRREHRTSRTGCNKKAGGQYERGRQVSCFISAATVHHSAVFHVSCRPHLQSSCFCRSAWRYVERQMTRGERCRQDAAGSPQAEFSIPKRDKQPVDAVLLLDVENRAPVSVRHRQEPLCNCRRNPHISIRTHAHG